MRFKLTLIFLAIVLLLSACNTTQPTEPEITEPIAGGEIAIGLDTQNLQLDPLGYSLNPGSIYDIDSILYRGLLHYNNSLELTPDLASSFTINNEAKSINIKLKENVKFEDGTNITIEDVKFSLEWYSQSEYNGSWKDYTFNIIGTDLYRRGKAETVEGLIINPADNSLTINYNQLTSEDLQLLTAPILSKKQIEGKTVNEVKNLASTGKLLATGSFKLTSKSEQEWIIEKNQAFEENVYLDKIKFSQLVETNDYELTTALPQNTENLLENKTVVTTEGTGYHYLGMNLTNEVLKDSSVRKAIALGIDYQKILDEIYFGYADKPLSPIHPESWAYTTTNTANNSLESTNLEEAKTLLNGKSISLNLAYQDTPFYNQLATELKNQLSQIGINIELKPIPSDKYISSLYFKGEYDLFISSWAYELDPLYENHKWLSKNDVLNGGLNISHINDETNDNLLIKGFESVNTEERKTVYTEWQNHFISQNYLIKLASPQQIFIADERLKIEINNSLVPYQDIEKWWVIPKVTEEK